MRDGPGPLALKLRELRWMRAVSGVEERLARWDGAGDPYTPAIELGEHHQVSLYAAREAALDAVVARGGFGAVPTRLDQAVWHWGMVLALGGPDLREAVAAKFLHDGYFRDAPHITWTAALPFLLADFGERERLGLAQAVDALRLGSDVETSWVLHALARVGFAGRFERTLERLGARRRLRVAGHVLPRRRVRRPRRRRPAARGRPAVEGRGDQLGARRAWRACTSDLKPKK